MIGYTYNPEPLSGDRSKQLSQKYLQKDDSSQSKQAVKMPDKFTVKWR